MWDCSRDDGPRLADGDAILGSEFFVHPADDDGLLRVEATSHTDTSATCWLSGGVLGNTYRVRNKATTRAGRTDLWSIRYRIRERG